MRCRQVGSNRADDVIRSSDVVIVVANVELRAR